MADDKFTIEADDFIVSEGEKGPSIRFSEQVKERLYRPWRTSIIIKLMGKSHTYNFVLARLQHRWGMIKGPWKLIDLENGFFTVRFVLEEDMKAILCGGPWVIAGQYLVMQRWKPGFDPLVEQVTRMTVWVRIIGLHVEWFRPEAMLRIGDLLGTTFKVDSNTVAQVRGKYARVCVEIDLTQPLQAFVQVEDNWYGLEYEGIHLVCFACGCYGHNKNVCPSVIKKPHTENVQNTTQLMDEGTPSASPLPVNKASSDAMPQDDPHESSGTLIGPWSLVQNRKGKKPFKANANLKAKMLAPKLKEPNVDRGASPAGSRFEALDNDKNKVDSHAAIGNVVVEEVSQIQTETNAGPAKPSKFKGQSKLKGKARQALGDISNDGVVDKPQIGIQNNISCASTTKVGPQSRFEPKRKLKGAAAGKSSGFQVRSIDFHEATLGDVVARLKSKLPNAGKSPPPILAGVEPPDPGPAEDKLEDIPGDKMDDDHGENSAPQITINLDAARLKKAMLDVKNGVVGAASTLVEVLNASSQ
ncbi:hypothetical protein L3X38_017098 [Prunus dulcis]|uniref:DUF4283 domain-containing protein n=1 Tax=Prunus dulcis TaxID=3755 RepID=A0AAD4W8G4_PRUDU|nr:hypothetical protein L3X38_017098 [Prunus dulcis]